MTGQAKLSYDELLTTVVEIEMVINSRSLSYISLDEIEYPLTHSHLMAGRRVTSLPDHIYCDIEDGEEVTSDLLDRTTRQVNNTLNGFWLR